MPAHTLSVDLMGSPVQHRTDSSGQRHETGQDSSSRRHGTSQDGSSQRHGTGHDGSGQRHETGQDSSGGCRRAPPVFRHAPASPDARGAERCSFKEGWRKGPGGVPSAAGMEGATAEERETGGSEDSCGPSVPCVPPAACAQACFQQQQAVDVRKRGRSPKRKLAHVAGEGTGAAAHPHRPSAGVGVRTEVARQQGHEPAGVVGAANARTKQAHLVSSRHVFPAAGLQPSGSAECSAAPRSESSVSVTGEAVAPGSPFIAPSPFSVRRRHDKAAGAAIVTASTGTASDHGVRSETESEVIVID